MSGWATIYNISSSALQRQSQELGRLQEQASSGRRVIRPSDDPGAAYRIMGLRHEAQDTEAYLESLHQVSSSLSSASGTLQEVSTALIRVKELMTQATTDTYSDADRHAIAMEIDGLLEHVVGLANHQFMDKYLFAGAAVDRPPFETTVENGRIARVDYVGSDQDLWAPVAPGVKYEAGLVGSDIFQVDNRQDAVFFGNTGAKAGVGTDNLRGSEELIIAHRDTFIAQSFVGDNGNINLVPGPSSAEKDTIVGRLSHTITIDADNNTIWMDNGEPVHWDDTTNDLAVTNEHGDVVYLDTTGVTWPAGVKTVYTWARYKGSLDGGQTWDVKDFDYGESVSFSNPNTGEVVYVDITNMARLGTERYHVPGTEDVFSVLIEARDALLASNQMSDEVKDWRLGTIMDSLDTVMDGTMQSLTSIGSKEQALEMLGNRMEDLSLNIELEAGAIGEADIVQVAIDLAKTQNFYEMTLMSISKMMSMSLLDFLQ